MVVAPCLSEPTGFHPYLAKPLDSALLNALLVQTENQFLHDSPLLGLRPVS